MVLDASNKLEEAAGLGQSIFSDHGDVRKGKEVGKALKELAKQAEGLFGKVSADLCLDARELLATEERAAVSR